MARKPRVEFAGTFYHVIVRGNQRQKIIYDDKDRLSYLRRLEYYRERYGSALCAGTDRWDVDPKSPLLERA